MCGIAGTNIFEDNAATGLRIAAMLNAIHHRGPDSSGQWSHEAGSLKLAHVRLSILDLSPLGHQPMASVSGRYVISFNGEVYNFSELKNDLLKKGYSFRGGSDTEVMLAAFEEWGLEQAVKKFNGMFAFALYDFESNKLFLCRDRVGKKPIYYWHDASGEWIFCSEIKGILAARYRSFDVDREALSQFVKYGYIPNPLSILKGVFEVPPGSIVTFDLNNNSKSESAYWDAAALMLQGISQENNSPREQINRELDSLLRDAVRLRMVADVPLGAFLSGGIDSSLVVAMMQSMSTEKIKTYTIGFDDKKYNEAQHAREVASYLGTDHHELYITEKNLLEIVDDLPSIMDEPLADVSILPTFIVSQLAAKDIKVVLSGDGGDEFFCGYGHYIKLNEINHKISLLPSAIRAAVATLLEPFIPRGSVRAVRALAILKSNGFDSLCSAVLSQWQMPAQLVKDGVNAEKINSLRFVEAGFDDIRRFAMLRDIKRYMVDDILHKVDRATMAVSIEARAPLLDYRLIEYSFGVPLESLNNGSIGKLPLRDILSKYLPKALYDRPKQGFGVPISKWLRADLFAWASDILASSVIDEFFYRDAIDKMWAEHTSGKYDRGAYLWNVIIFVHWYKSIFSNMAKK